MLDTLLLIGSDHRRDVYHYVLTKLSNHKPDLVTLESEIVFRHLRIGPGYSEEIELPEILAGPKKIERKSIRKGVRDRIGLYLDGEELSLFDPSSEFTAGMDYALNNNLPLFC